MTTDPFTEARAGSPEPCTHHWVSHGQDSALIPWVIQCDLCGAFDIAEMERAARAHLAQQNPLTEAIRAVATTTAYTGQDITAVGNALAKVMDPEPTDAEVEAAAIIIARTVSFDADPDLAGYRALGLDVLTAARRVRAARAARRDEETR